MRKLFFTGLYVVLCTVLPLSAQIPQSPLQPGRYACNGTAYAMQITSLFGSSGMASLYEHDKLVSSALIKISGGNIAFTFTTGGDKYRGKTWVYNLSGSQSFEGNGESWFRISDGLYTLPGPASPSPGSITTPGPDYAGNLQSGNYSLSGGKRRMYLTITNGHGRGTLYDESGSIAGEFRITINGERLSLSFISGKNSGVIYDYHIQSSTSFSHPGELWVRRY